MFFKQLEAAKIQGIYFKIQGIYFKIQGTYFKIYALYFLRSALCLFLSTSIHISSGE